MAHPGSLPLYQQIAELLTVGPVIGSTNAQSQLDPGILYRFTHHLTGEFGL